jgi:hypothetical protein
MAALRRGSARMRVEGLGEQLLGLAGQEDVDEREQAAGVREGERAAGDDDRVVRAAVRGEHRDAGALEQADDAGELELVGHGEAITR